MIDSWHIAHRDQEAGDAASYRQQAIQVGENDIDHIRATERRQVAENELHRHKINKIAAKRTIQKRRRIDAVDSILFVFAERRILDLGIGVPPEHTTEDALAVCTNRVRA